jgi:hypothetical protein
MRLSHGRHSVLRSLFQNFHQRKAHVRAVAAAKVALTAAANQDATKATKTTTTTPPSKMEDAEVKSGFCHTVRSATPCDFLVPFRVAPYM